MAARKRWLAVAAIWCLFFEWWRTASATVLSQGVGSLEIRHLERVDVHELPDSGVVWSKEVQALSGEKELRSSSFYDISSILERMDTTETKQLVTGLSATTTSGGTSTICMWKRSSTSKPKPGVESSWSGEVIRQIKQVEKALSSLDMDAPVLEAARKLLEQQITELKTQQKAQQPLSKRLESARGALQRAQRRAEEARVAFTLAQTVELCTLEQEAHKAATEATGVHSTAARTS